ncbi:MAG: archease [Thermoleophilia bacterium]
MAGSYRILHHPADLLLEVHGGGLGQLAENALFALYDSVVEVDAVELKERAALGGDGADAAQALRALLAEALFLIDAEGFLGGAARVEASTEGDTVALRAGVWGEHLDQARHELKAEVKAVTYHRLTVQEDAPGAWRATFLLDV